jgi:hypothetical protein
MFAERIASQEEVRKLGESAVNKPQPIPMVAFPMLAPLVDAEFAEQSF